MLTLDHARISAYTSFPETNPSGYLGQSRPEMQVYVPDQTRTLLDIGCSEGNFARAIKDRIPTCETWGIEPDGCASEIASSVVDHVINSQFSPELDLPRRYFDVVTMNDSLEHICDTDGTLTGVKAILKPGGLLILSLPNVAYYVHAMEYLIRNNWQYGENGILDRTHYRFFTARSIRQTLIDNGYTVELIRGLPIASPPLKWRILFFLFPRRTYWMRFFQLAVVARIPL